MPVVRIGLGDDDDFDGIADTELEQGNPGTNKHTEEVIEITKFGSGDHRDGMFVVDFSAFRASISNAPITLTSAALNLWPTALHAGLVIGVFLSLRAAVASQATWNNFASGGGNVWTAGGGRGNGTDRVATQLGELASILPAQFNAAALNAASLQTIINAGGLLILTLERTDAANDSQFSAWRSSDNSSTDERPYLLLDYSLDAGGTPTVTDAGDESFRAGETGVVITGTNFGATQDSGFVRICPSDDVDDVNGVNQTVTAWADTTATIDIVRGTLPLLTDLYLFVQNDAGNSNAAGRVVQLTPPPAVLAASLLMN